ncbi:ribulose-phosphate 3-epimerase [bacterium]
MKNIQIAPSILSADFADLASAIKKIEQAGAFRIHLDVMDGHFVNNITFGPPLVKSIRPRTKLILESHLMIENPKKFIDAFKKAGSDIIIIHYETSSEPQKLLNQIKETGAQAGISINPGTPWEKIKDLLELVDIVLVMTVNPGFGGQLFIHEVLDKIKELKKYIQENNLSIDIEVDGGINTETIKPAAQAGANIIVAGSSIFNKHDPVKAIIELKESAERAVTED